jgi:transposase-like protein
MIGNAQSQVSGRWLNNRAKNSHQPFRRREAAMAKFRDVKSLQKFAAAHASTSTLNLSENPPRKTAVNPATPARPLKSGSRHE